MLITKTSLAEQARNALLESIVSGKLAAGTRLTEEALSQQYGISRTPVRDALARLEADGLIERLPSRGYQIKKLDPAAVEELLSCRIEVEMRIFENDHSNISFAGMQELYDELAALDVSVADAFAQARKLDDALHSMINDACCNRYWREFHNRLLNQRLPYRDIRNNGSAELALQLKEERLKLLKAILSGDKTQGRDALFSHLDNGRKAILQVLNSTRQDQTI